MINFKNILKVLLIALFVCAWSVDVRADEAKVDSETGRIQRDLNDTSPCPDGTQWVSPDNSCMPIKATGGGGANDASFCSGDLGIFKELVQTGQMIFNRLRDLIYVVAGFGIIAVAVGGFFGNLNWKWLGAIVISLVVIATAGELIVLMTGCESFSGSLITNTLSEPAPLVSNSGNNPYTSKYNEKYIDEGSGSDVGQQIKWGANVERDSWVDYSVPVVTGGSGQGEGNDDAFEAP